MYRDVHGDVGRVTQAWFRLVAKLLIGMDPSLEGPGGDPARERTFRRCEVSEKLAGILSKRSRHVLLPLPYDRCAMRHGIGGPRRYVTFEARELFPNFSAARTRLAEPEHAPAAFRWPSMVKDGEINGSATDQRRCQESHRRD